MHGVRPELLFGAQARDCHSVSLTVPGLWARHCGDCLYRYRYRYIYIDIDIDIDIDFYIYIDIDTYIYISI